MQDFVYSFWLQLQEFLAMRLVHEGKAWKDEYGRWLIHEGETMEQAKARVNDKERQRLKQQAIEDYEAKTEQAIQEWEKYIAEENARLAEEDRLETEADPEKLNAGK
jgi:GH24 family phage-related lysozyme (muramidase)